MPTYARIDVAFDHGSGAYLFDTNGRRYLDFGSGIAVTVLGHAHPHLVDALTKQAGKVWHTSNLYRIPEQERLAERLAAASFADRVFFCNSGAEASEGAFKLIRKYQSASGHPERTRIISVDGSFHGRTFAALASAKNPKHTEGFGPMPDGFDQVAFGNMNELRAAITPETGGIVVEPVQGEGGIRPATLRYLKELREVADEHGLLLFFDEVQCGMGRTGKMFAYEWAGMAPDVMTLAKGLGGGFPIGAILASERAAVGMIAGTHGSTFGGNPMACAVANAVLDVLEKPGFLEGVDQTARKLWSRLQDLVARHPKVLAEVRGAGMMLGLRCVMNNGEIGKALMDRGLLTVGAAENVIRLLPPLVIGDAEIDEALTILDETCTAMAAAAPAAA